MLMSTAWLWVIVIQSISLYGTCKYDYPACSDQYKMPVNQIEENVLPPVRLIYSYMNITIEADIEA